MKMMKEIYLCRVLVDCIVICNSYKMHSLLHIIQGTFMEIHNNIIMIFICNYKQIKNRIR